MKIKRILLPLTLDASSVSIAKAAAEMASTHQAELILVYACEPVGSFGNAIIENYLPLDARSNFKQNRQKLLQDLRQQMKQFYSEHMAKITGVAAPAEVICEEERATTLILNSAKQLSADMIIMGSHARSGLSAMLIGNTAREITQLSEIPVLLVPLKNS
ncbi:universal stress protein [Pelagibaculum spongiae]|uniref:UspA domain-containing protein n=1 Tax=Pelagibaculum spongiae TaxID=2080658 RepID=A0A2V1H1Q6_9GAMM|nr:universal stress protein [Pelagibaculum spongiae]PVZ68816.1 hypothetical protein DC094_11195 [Pelagibaculum spongiae]